MGKRQTKAGDHTASLFEEAVGAIVETIVPEAAAPAVDPKLLPANFPESWTRAIGSEFAKPYFAELRQFIVEERKAHDILPPGLQAAGCRSGPIRACSGRGSRRRAAARRWPRPR